MILTIKFDLDRTQMNIYTKYIDQMLFRSRIISRHTDRHTYNGTTDLG